MRLVESGFPAQTSQARGDAGSLDTLTSEIPWRPDKLPSLQTSDTASGPAVRQALFCNRQCFQCSCASTVHASTVQRFTLQRLNESLHFFDDLLQFSRHLRQRLATQLHRTVRIFAHNDV